MHIAQRKALHYCGSSVKAQDIKPSSSIQLTLSHPNVIVNRLQRLNPAPTMSGDNAQSTYQGYIDPSWPNSGGPGDAGFIIYGYDKVKPFEQSADATVAMFHPLSSAGLLLRSSSLHLLRTLGCSTSIVPGTSVLFWLRQSWRSLAISFAYCPARRTLTWCLILWLR